MNIKIIGDYVLLELTEWYQYRQRPSGVYTFIDSEKLIDVLEHNEIWRLHKNYACAYSKIWCHDIFIHQILVSYKRVDHKNKNRLDNRLSNLRPANKSENAINFLKTKKTSSKFRGLCWNKWHSKWQVTGTKNSKSYHLGYYSNEIEAAKVYDKFAKEFHKEFAQLNFPEPEPIIDEEKEIEAILKRMDWNINIFSMESIAEEKLKLVKREYSI